MSVYSFALKLNGTDVASYGVKVAELQGNWDGPDVSYDETPLVGGEGTVATQTDPTLAPREFVVLANLSKSTLSEYEAALHSLKYGLLKSSLTLIGGNQTTIQRTGYYAGLKSSPYPSGAAGKLEIRIHCRNPLGFATSASSVTGLAATDLPCALGTYKCRPTVTVANPTSPLVLTYKHYDGTTEGSLTLTFTGAPASVVADMANKTVTADGARHDEYVTAGDFFALDPQHGDYDASHWPTVQASSGSGTPDVTIAYTQAFA